MSKSFFIRNSLPQRRSLGYRVTPSKQARVESFNYYKFPSAPGDVLPSVSMTGTVVGFDPNGIDPDDDDKCEPCEQESCEEGKCSGESCTSKGGGVMNESFHYNYRYYNPLDGRWTRRDPIGIGGGNNTKNASIYHIDVQGRDYIEDIYCTKAEK